MDRSSRLQQPGSKEVVPALAGAIPARTTLQTPTVGPPEAIQTQSSKRLLQLGRVVWLAVAVLTSGLYIASIGPRYEQFANPSATVRHALSLLPMSVGTYAAYNLALELSVAVVFSLVGLVIFWRKSQDGVGLVVAFMLLLCGSALRPIVNTLDALLAVQPVWQMPVNVLTYLTWFHVVAFFCIFPDGRFVPRWTLWLLVATAVILVPWDLFPDSPLSPWQWPPIPFIALELALWGSCLYAQVYRYRQLSNRIQRQQTKWVVYGASTTVIAGLAFYFPRTLDSALNQPGTAATLLYDLVTLTGMYLAVLMTPLSIGISIFRFRLWGIDMLINRTLVYVPLTAILAGIYSASIAFFQKGFLALTGDKSDAAIVITTLILATLFTPVKNGLQTFVDKRFKEAPNPARILKAFNEQIEEDVAVIDPYRAGQRLVEEAVQAFEAEGGAIYLEPDQIRPLYTVGKWLGDAALIIPLEHAGATLGRLVLGPRPHGLEYSLQDRANVQATVDLVAEAIAQSEPDDKELPSHPQEATTPL